MKDVISSVRELAEEAVRGDQAMKEAIASERTSKVVFLESLVEVVRDALPSVTSRVPAYAAGKASEYGSRVDRWMEAPFERALLVGGSERPEPPKKKIEGVEPLSGSGLYLAESGVFFVVSFDGRYRNSAKLDDYWWEAKARALVAREVVQDRWAVERVADALAAELEIQVAGKKKATARSLKVAARVREAATILAGVR